MEEQRTTTRTRQVPALENISYKHAAVESYSEGQGWLPMCSVAVAHAALMLAAQPECSEAVKAGYRSVTYVACRRLLHNLCCALQTWEASYAGPVRPKHAFTGSAEPMDPWTTYK